MLPMKTETAPALSLSRRGFIKISGLAYSGLSLGLMLPGPAAAEANPAFPAPLVASCGDGHARVLETVLRVGGARAGMCARANAACRVVVYKRARAKQARWPPLSAITSARCSQSAGG